MLKPPKSDARAPPLALSCYEHNVLKLQVLHDAGLMSTDALNNARRMLQNSPALAAPNMGLDAPNAGVDGVLAAPKLKPEPCVSRKHVSMADMVGIDAKTHFSQRPDIYRRR